MTTVMASSAAMNEIGNGSLTLRVHDQDGQH